MSDARRQLNFNSEDDVIAEVHRLRTTGYARGGKWSLPQICAHLDKATQFRMQRGPFPPNTPDQDARGSQFRGILASGKLPEGIVSPDPMLPPAECGEDAIDAFIATLTTFKSFPGPIAPHRIFGQLSDADARRLSLIHCAHHLAYLTPTATS